MQTAKIVNKTKNVVLAERAKIANNPWTRMRGLLGSAGLAEGEGLIIKPCNSIHTFFMKFSIDVIFLDKNMKVIKIANSLKSWRSFESLMNGRIAIELPSGKLNITNTKLDDFIDIICPA